MTAQSILLSHGCNLYIIFYYNLYFQQKYVINMTEICQIVVIMHISLFYDYNLNIDHMYYQRAVMFGLFIYLQNDWTIYLHRKNVDSLISWL
jgi:hypothetical protein